MPAALHSSNGQQFAGKVAVVTGGAQGIGLAIARQLHALGAAICIVDCDDASSAAAQLELARPQCPPVTLVSVDLANSAAGLAVAKSVAATHGRIDVLVNNAAIELEQPFDQVTAERWDRLMAINLRAPLLLTQALVPLFPADGGAIINISSIHANRAFPGSIPYACSKAGLLALTRNLALELAERRIRVNAICPGYIDTRLWDEYLRNSENPEALAEETRALHPLGRRGLPSDVVGAAVFLAGEESSFMTGTSLTVDGGLTIRAHP
jgi:NAD(P)-dependent dehydrogenase (short-subunit alcohol dehydrogenase family)